MVYIRDDIERSPVENHRVPAGVVPLRIELGGYKDVIDTLNLARDEVHDTTITLVLRTGSMKLKTSPAGARIFLDDEDTGHTTPKVLDDLPINKRYDVRFTLAGHEPREIRNYQVYEDSQVVAHRQLSRLTASVHIVSQPSRASIFVKDASGKPVVAGSKTPQPIELKHGEYRLVLKKEGYHDFEVDFVVPVREQASPGDVFGRNKIDVTMSRLPPGTLIVKVTPYATILLNDDVMITEDVRYENDALDQGEYIVVLRHPNYKAVRKVVQVVSGKTITWSYNFITEGELQ